MNLESEIKPGSRVKVSALNKYKQDVSYYATVVDWTLSGQLRVEPDTISASGIKTKCVSASRVKKLK
nr:hypothetical protein A6C57_00180 [Fibrella sp. ES10-3-2-2]